MGRSPTLEVPDVFRVSGISLVDIFLTSSYLNEVELFSNLFYTISHAKNQSVCCIGLETECRIYDN